ncbi:MAG: hypothetical protein ABEJ95_02305 [Candidatus Nanohalobium sp.]
MKDYEVLSEDFEDVKIGEYSPAVWTPEEVMARDRGKYDVEEPESEEISHDIISIVQERRREAEESGAEFYNGPLIRLTDYRVEDGQLQLDIQNTNYFSHAGTRDRPELGKENRADPLSVGAYLRTADHVVLGERSGIVELGEGEYQLAGAGFIEDPELQYERSLNAQSSSPIHRELEEEVNLDHTQITAPEPSALVGAIHRQPMLVYDTETVLDPEEVVEEWRRIDEEEREFSELIFVPEDEIDAALEGETDILLSDGDGVRTGTYEGELRPHAEGTLEAFS